jgi:lipopolysaccharide transport system permease protein
MKEQAERIQSRLDLLLLLVAKELKVRYKRSVLGFLWTFLTPLAMMGIFTFIFEVVFRFQGIPSFPVFFLTGFLAWQYFSGGLLTGTASVVANAGLVKKVAFPREVLPLSAVLAQGVHACLALLVFMGILGALGWPVLSRLPLLLLGLLVTTLLASGFAFAASALNVTYRDVQELLTVVVMLWFYATPVVFPLSLVPPKFALLVKLNPVSWAVELFRLALYYPRFSSGWGSPQLLAAAVFGSLAIFLSGWAVFRRLSPGFAREL